jgi:hypothetical protein
MFPSAISAVIRVPFSKCLWKDNRRFERTIAFRQRCHVFQVLLSGRGCLGQERFEVDVCHIMGLLFVSLMPESVSGSILVQSEVQISARVVTWRCRRHLLISSSWVIENCCRIACSMIALSLIWMVVRVSSLGI